MQEHVEMETSIPTWVDMFALSYIESKTWYNKLKCCLVADQDQTFFHIEPSSAMAGMVLLSHLYREEFKSVGELSSAIPSSEDIEA